MKVLITGGTGLVGSSIIKKLIARGDEVINLTTRKSKEGQTGKIQNIYWNPDDTSIALPVIDQVDAVINLAGYNVANRWTEKTKALIVSSRMNTTRQLMKLISNMSQKPRVMVSTSASGYYTSSDSMQDETAKPGSGFLADLCVDWEREALKAKDHSIRTVIIRVGVVLAANDGAVAKMLPFFKLGLGSATGSGKQWMSWIQLEDLSNMYIHALDFPMEGVYNGNAPQNVTNDEYSKVLAQTLKRPYFLPNIPAFFLKLLFGEMSSMLLNSQRISAQRIQDAGFKFQYPTIREALAHTLS